MSISAIGATTPSQAIQASSASAVTADATATFSNTAATNASGLGNFFQQFASDLQSLLTQTQAATTGSATTGTTTGTTTAGTTNTTTTTTGTTPADTTTQAATEQPSAVHHHHHHGGGGGPLQNAANQFVGQVAQVLGGGSGNATPAPGVTANGANTLATDIVQALQNYGAFANNPATSTVSTLA